VAVSGANASPSSFPGSITGTYVSVGGSYSVVATNMQGYTPTYSQGCTGTLGANEHATCIVTEGNSAPYNSYPTPYPFNYPYPNPALTCTPATQTVGLGQSVTFTALGDTNGPLNWATAQRTFLSIGPSLTTTLQNTGTQTVTVSNNYQSATCTVVVVPGFVPGTTYPNTLYQNGVISTGPVTVVPTYIPHLPNTGFEPLNAASVAFALAALIAAAFITLPYVRKAFAVILG
jgi:hypothetical protein